MARAKEWTARIVQIIKAVEEHSASTLSRRDVEAIFGCGASQAKARMESAGSTTEVVAGVTVKMVGKQALLDYLKYSREGAEALREYERQVRLAKELDHAGQKLKQRNIVIESATPADRWVGLKDLPNVILEPHKLTVEFVDREHLLRTMYQFANAIANDWEALEKAGIWEELNERKAG